MRGSRCASGVIYTFRGGKIVRGREYATREQAVEAAGLRE
jgi:ketosteroid isomerase-like protein